MEDIAAEFGITARALYRHYDNKQAILMQVVSDDQGRLLEVLGSNMDHTPWTPDEFNEALRILANASMASKRVSLLWQREARHLTERDYATVRARAQATAAQFAAVFLRDYDRMLGGASIAEIRSWAGLSLLTSLGHIDDVNLRPSLLLDTLVGAVSQVVDGRRSVPMRDADFPVAPSFLPIARREQILDGAAAVIRRKGYSGANIEDIGAVAGVVGPALYRYFDSKAEILLAIVTRFFEWLALETRRGLTRGGSAFTVLDALAAGHVKVALEATDLLAVTLNECLHLPAGDQERITRIQADDVSEWVYWLRQARPDQSEQGAYARVRIARVVIGDLALIPHFRKDPRFASELNAIVRVVLLT